MKQVQCALWFFCGLALIWPARAFTCPESGGNVCCCAQPVAVEATCCAADAAPVGPSSAHQCPCVIQSPGMPATTATIGPPSLRGHEMGILDFRGLDSMWFVAPPVPQATARFHDIGPPPAAPAFILYCSLLR